MKGDIAEDEPEIPTDPSNLLRPNFSILKRPRSYLKNQVRGKNPRLKKAGGKPPKPKIINKTGKHVKFMIQGEVQRSHGNNEDLETE